MAAGIQEISGMKEILDIPKDIKDIMEGPPFSGISKLSVVAVVVEASAVTVRLAAAAAAATPPPAQPYMVVKVSPAQMVMELGVLVRLVAVAAPVMLVTQARFLLKMVMVARAFRVPSRAL